MDITNFPVMPNKCETCPFRFNNQGRHPDERLVARVQQDVIANARQICHHPRLLGKPETHLCRGARDFQLQVFYRLGYLAEPTDECWEQIRNQP